MALVEFGGRARGFVGFGGRGEGGQRFAEGLGDGAGHDEQVVGVEPDAMARANLDAYSVGGSNRRAGGCAADGARRRWLISARRDVDLERGQKPQPELGPDERSAASAARGHLRPRTLGPVEDLVGAPRTLASGEHEADLIPERRDQLEFPLR